jgi:hypothetical protein
MNEVQEARFKEHNRIHAAGKVTRLQVNPKGADLRELINGTLKSFKAGEVFDHPAPLRVAQLLEIQPPLVFLSNLPTEAEKVTSENEDKVAVDLAMDELREKAKKIILGRKEKLGKLDKMLRGMTKDVLQAEADKRGLKELGDNLEIVIAAILADEKVKLEQAD